LKIDAKESFQSHQKFHQVNFYENYQICNFIIFFKTCTESLDKDEFIEILSNCLESSVYNEEIEKLFNKLDSKNLGRVTWSEFCGHLLTFFSQKAYSESLKITPFDTEPKIKHAPHNRVRA
jgi:Ca2+-binding EF-hand superfamily protein